MAGQGALLFESVHSCAILVKAAVIADSGTCMTTGPSCAWVQTDPRTRRNVENTCLLVVGHGRAAFAGHVDVLL